MGAYARSDSQPATAATPGGTHDGLGAGDHDQPYRFGRRPRASAPYPFSTRQYGRLVVLRGRLRDGLWGADDVAA
ncbi:MAG: hypothetical protein M3336_00255 [Chloroflexota bacterium]|nr:hypothetical protein [Chloroflexota bacterium]